MVCALISLSFHHPFNGVIFYYVYPVGGSDLCLFGQGSHMNTNVDIYLLQLPFYLYKISNKMWISYDSMLPTNPFIYILLWDGSEINHQPWFNKQIKVLTKHFVNGKEQILFPLLSLPSSRDASFLTPSFIFLSPTLNEWAHTGGHNRWQHLGTLQNTKGICVYQKRSKHPHSIMWQSNQASRDASHEPTTVVVKLLKAFSCTVQLQISLGLEYIEVKHFLNDKQNTTMLHHYPSENIHTYTVHTQYIQYTQGFELMSTIGKKIAAHF